MPKGHNTGRRTSWPQNKGNKSKRRASWPPKNGDPGPGFCVVQLKLSQVRAEILFRTLNNFKWAFVETGTNFPEKVIEQPIKEEKESAPPVTSQTEIPEKAEKKGWKERFLNWETLATLWTFLGLLGSITLEMIPPNSPEMETASTTNTVTPTSTDGTANNNTSWLEKVFEFSLFLSKAASQHNSNTIIAVFVDFVVSFGDMWEYKRKLCTTLLATGVVISNFALYMLNCDHSLTSTASFISTAYAFASQSAAYCVDDSSLFMFCSKALFMLFFIAAKPSFSVPTGTNAFVFTMCSFLAATTQLVVVGRIAKKLFFAQSLIESEHSPET